MFKTFNRWLNHHSYFRYGYFLLLIIIVFLYSFFPNYRNFYLLFIVSVIFLGIGFYNKPTWVIFLLTVITGVFKIFLLPEQISDVSTLLIQLSSYLIIAFISVGLRKNVQIVHEDQIELVTALSKALDTRDSYTLHHSENAAKYAIEIAEKMKLPKDLCNSIRIGGLLHDIGKIGIPENILNK
ncbi:MAG TPA: HD domain-containing phosphohydrolase, partial [Neobacillus sp.]